MDSWPDESIHTILGAPWLANQVFFSFSFFFFLSFIPTRCIVGQSTSGPSDPVQRNYFRNTSPRNLPDSPCLEIKRLKTAFTSFGQTPSVSIQGLDQATLGFPGHYEGCITPEPRFIVREQNVETRLLCLLTAHNNH